MGGADLTGPDAVAVTAAGVGVLALQCTRALLEIHLVAAVSAEQKAGEQVDLITLGWTVLRGDPLLCKVKGFFVNQSLIGIGEEILLFFRIAPRFFGLSCLIYSAMALQRKVAIWPRVQVALGSNLPLPTPVVMPFSTAQATALA